MPYGLPHISYIGHPVPIPCPPHAGLGFREAGPADSPAILAHFRDLTPLDRRMRFCATLNDEALERHVAEMWDRESLVLAAYDGPLWSGPLTRAGPVRALAELALGPGEAELALSVEDGLRRRGVGTYLLQTAARLAKPRGIARIHAYTLPDNASFLALARTAGGAIEPTDGEVEVTFDVAALERAYLRRRAAQVCPLRLPA
jgi:GNAT superfamily N-acetyltransferase